MIDAEELERPGDPEFMTSLARGLVIMRCVAEAEKSANIASLNRQTGLSRAAIRRCLHTLTLLGYVKQEGAGYVVQRKALGLGHPYLSLTTMAAQAQPLLDALRDELGESCSLGVMEDDQLHYVARAEAFRIMSIGLKVGSRLPLYPTSMGRVLLSGCSVQDQRAYLERTDIRALTPRTLTDVPSLLAAFCEVTTRGFALVDQELEMGLRSVAVPVMRGRKVVAALNVGVAVGRVSMDQLRRQIIPALQKAAQKLGN